MNILSSTASLHLGVESAPDRYDLTGTARRASQKGLAHPKVDFSTVKRWYETGPTVIEYPTTIKAHII